MGAYDVIVQGVRIGVVGWLALLAALILYRCVNGRINLNGLLARSERHAADGLPSPERVQLLFAFLIAVVAYARLTIHSMHGAQPPAALPEAPVELIALFAASHGIYLGGKLGWMFNLKQFISKPGG